MASLDLPFHKINIMNIIEKDDYYIIEMPDHADPSLAELPSAIQKSKKKFVLDVKNIPHLYSAGMGYITLLQMEIAEGNGTLCIVNANEEVESGLRALKLDTIIPIYSSLVDFELEQGSPLED